MSVGTYGKMKRENKCGKLFNIGQCNFNISVYMNILIMKSMEKNNRLNSEIIFK